MERTNHPSAGPGNTIVSGVAGVTPPTTFTAAVANAVVEELANLVEGQGIVLIPGQYTQVEQAIRSIVGSQAQNPIINGDFRIAQRAALTSATAVTTSPTYLGPDRWLVDIGELTEAGTANRQPFTLGQQDVSGAEWYMRLTKTTVLVSGGGPGRLAQRIEDVNTLAGKDVVLGFNGLDELAVGTADVEVEFVQHFGTGGSPSSDVVTTVAASQILNASWTRHTYTATLPSVSGKTLGTNGDDYLEVRIQLKTGLGGDIGITNVSLSEGSLDPGFVKRPFAEELLLCQRYFEKSYEEGVDVGANSSAGASRCIHQQTVNALVEGLEKRFATPKRATPTVTWYSTDGTSGNILYNGSNNTVTSSSPSKSNTGVPTLTGSPPTGLVSAVAQWAADSEL